MRFVRIVNKDKESGILKSMECFPARNIQQICFDSMEDENHKRFYYIRIFDTMGSTRVCVSQREDECYDAFNRFYLFIIWK